MLATLLTNSVIYLGYSGVYFCAPTLRSGCEFVKRRRSGLFVIGQERVPFQLFRAGEDIVETGLHQVFHAGGVSHYAVLCAGRPFPRCKECGDNVQFELLQSLPLLDNDRYFRSLTLYEIPHPSVEQAEAVKEAG